VTAGSEPPSDDLQSREYERFVRLLTSIAAVPKAVIYAIDPGLRPKRKSSPEVAERDEGAAE
jgi:hypothetical protein